MNRIPTTERLAKALTEAGAPECMTRKAKEGYYDDYKSELAAPILQLTADCFKHGLQTMVERAKAGEFDAQQWEGDEWAASSEGQRAIADLNKFLPRR